MCGHDHRLPKRVLYFGPLLGLFLRARLCEVRHIELKGACDAPRRLLVRAMPAALDLLDGAGGSPEASAKFS
jgi:hypothetical protein